LFVIAIETLGMSFASSPLARQTPANQNFIHRGVNMRKEYDFSTARKNPYAAQLKQQITIRLDKEPITYFKTISEDVGLPYQGLINLYLRDCAASHRKLNLNWA